MSYAKPVTKRVNVSTSKKPMISYEVKELIFEYKYVKRNEKKMRKKMWKKVKKVKNVKKMKKKHKRNLYISMAVCVRMNLVSRKRGMLSLGLWLIMFDSATLSQLTVREPVPDSWRSWSTMEAYRTRWRRSVADSTKFSSRPRRPPYTTSILSLTKRLFRVSLHAATGEGTTARYRETPCTLIHHVRPYP